MDSVVQYAGLEVLCGIFKVRVTQFIDLKSPANQSASRRVSSPISIRMDFTIPLPRSAGLDSEV